MSFGPSQAQKNAQKQQNDVTNQAVANSGQLTALGGDQVHAGASPVASGENFFNTLLNGNQANTTAMLQPSIDQIRANSSGTLGAINTLMPRTGGRAASLFSQSFQPLNSINNLFSQGRVAAAQTLPQLGLQQQQLGANLFGLGTNALNTGMTGTQNAVSNELANRQISNSLWGGIGSGLFGLATTPFGGGTGKNGLLGLI